MSRTRQLTPEANNGRRLAMNKTLGKIVFGVSVFGMTVVGSSIFTHAYAEGLGTGMVTGNSVNIRTGNNLSSKVVTQLNWNDMVTVLGQDNGWYHIRIANGNEGWIFGKYLSLRLSSDNTSRGSVDRSTVARMIDFGKKYLGTRYVYGGESPSVGFDCSGFTKYVFSSIGIDLPRTADSQATVGTNIDRSSLVPGDLVFFKTLGSKSINHAGIYIGNGQFIHASSGAGKVMISSLSSGYYNEHYATARRVVK